jgi:multidrug efflux pump subunit AcrA (membrane-fusion protein)
MKAQEEQANEVNQDERKILYYTCGMHPSIKVSPDDYEKGVKDCPICHMALTPVYEKSKDMEMDSDVISITSSELALAGVQTEQIRTITLFKEIEAVGVIAYDPELRSAQEEYLQALKTYNKVIKSQFEDAKARAKDVLDSAKIKLELLGLSSDSLKELEKQGEPDKSLILPQDNMWVYAHIYEYEASWPQKCDKVKIKSSVDPSFVFEGEIKSIEPILKEKSRTLRLKIIAKNKDRILKPNMYVDVYLKSILGQALALPKEAVLDTGKRKIVYVDLGKGNFQLREVIVGPLAQGLVKDKKEEFYPLIEGVNEGDLVVTKGNFLIDSQSKLGAASSAYGGALGEEGQMPAGHQH